MYPFFVKERLDYESEAGCPQSLSMKTKNAVILDRDGTLLHDRGFITDPDDVELARNFGGTGVYVLTGHGRKHTRELRHNVFVAENSLAAANHILEQPPLENKYCSSRQ
jgi:histidinol phosphatase-like enzyme